MFLPFFTDSIRNVRPTLRTHPHIQPPLLGVRHTVRQRIRRELVGGSGKVNFKNSPPLEGCPAGAGWFETPSHSTPSRFARHPSEREEFLEKRRETRRLPEPLLRGREIWSAAIRERSDFCRFFIRRYSATAHSPGVGVGFRKAFFKNSPPLEGCPAGVGWFETPSHSNHPVSLRSPPLRRRGIS